MNISFKRICILILDSLGIGELPDASDYGDVGANTLLHVHEALGGLKIPTLSKLGLGHFCLGAQAPNKVQGYFGRMIEISKGKDTTTGHWEMMGLPVKKAFSVFPKGFPKEIMDRFSHETGLGFLGNKPASGTVIIDELGEEHLKTGHPIVYTSADSVFQIACHEESFGLKELYEICEKTRTILNDSPFQVGRVIARPFLGKPGAFERTGNRRDFSLSPFGETILTKLKEKQFSTLGVGKIPDIFNGEGITTKLEAHNDEEAVRATMKALKEWTQPGLIFTNLNDLDMIYGHRRNTEGYGKHLEKTDKRIAEILKLLQPDDLLVIAADHGNDPTFKGTDHTREYVPLLLYSPRFKEGSVKERRLPDRRSFCDLGQTIAENFGVQPLKEGQSFLPLLKAI